MSAGVVVFGSQQAAEFFRLRLMRCPGAAEVDPRRRWLVTKGESRVWVTEGNDMEHELDATIPVDDAGRPMTCFWIEFSDGALFREVADRTLGDENLLVDNDHGWTGSGLAFTRLLRERPEWDWRLRST